MSGTSNGTSFIIRTGNGTINPPRFVLHEPTTSDVIGRKNYSLFTKKKKKKKIIAIEIQIQSQSLAKISNESKFILGLILTACL